MKYLISVFMLVTYLVASQDEVTGVIFEENSDNQVMPLAGANVFWLNSNIGDITDIDGKFKIPYKEEYNQLVISYVGFKTDTLTINAPTYIEHSLQASSALDEVTITSRNQTTTKSYLSAENMSTISSDELLKAACCNLSESFETNPSIDVNFADAVTGTKQIRMLGLTNRYILITTENIPSIRGASQAYGLSYIPGTWVESIQITKGAGSVVNGFESIAGQINTELQKPSSDDDIFINLYAATSERLEINTHVNTQIGEKLHTGVYLHGSTQRATHDVNNDGFLDMPKYNHINFMNRWQYTDAENGFVSFVNFRYLNDYKQSGQLSFDPDTTNLSFGNEPSSIDTDEAWGSEMKTNRFDFSSKLGYVNPDIPWQSLGIQFAYSYHNQDSYFGINDYDIKHNSIYSNVIYNSIIGDSRHKIKTGLGFTYDDYDEFAIGQNFDRTERSAGAFFEYSYDNLDKLTLQAGLRFDTHNLIGEFITPRLHLRYTPWEKSAFKASVGRGTRSANFFAENQSIFATSRAINILNSGGAVYGLDPEIAWNYGLSYLQGFNLFGRKADIALDFYRTDFQNQVVVDWENPDQLNFYNLAGKSFANSFQVELNYDAFEDFNLRTAYKYYDVQSDYLSGRFSKPLIPRHRIFANLAYDIKNAESGIAHWRFDTTFNWLSEQRFPSTEGNPVKFRLPKNTPSVTTINAQVTRVFSDKFEIYVGGENINNFRQDNPILGADNPFGSNFDTTFVFGPIFGSMYYAGLRYRIN